MRFLIAALLAAVLSPVVVGQGMLFKKVVLKTAYQSAKQGNNGRLSVIPDAIRFVGNNGTEYFSIPSSAVTDLFYSRVSGRRIKTAIFVTPLLLFSKGKKHYLTIAFDDGDKLVGAVEFKLHKSNCRGVLRAVEAVSDVALQFDMEGIKDEKETVATRSGASDKPDTAMATLKISSVPDGAEIEIDGSFVGTTPRTKILEPGKYAIKLTKAGFKSWQRKIEVAAGEQVPVKVELEKK